MAAAPQGQLTPRRGGLYLLSYGLALLGSVVFSMTPASVTLPLRIAQLDPLHKNDGYALATAIGTVVMLIATPLAGQMSDATSSRLGKRAPWIAAGSISTFLAAFLLAHATTVGAVVCAWALMALCISIGFSPLMAIIHEQFPPSQQGIASGMAGTTVLLGALLGSWLVQLFPRTPSSMFVIPAAVGSTLLMQFLLVLDDRLRPSESAAFDLRGFWCSFWFDPRSDRSFAWILVAITLTATGSFVLQSYVVYILQDSLRIADQDVAHAAFEAILAANAAGALLSLAGGVLSDWLGRQKLLYAAGATCLALGLVVEVLSTTMVTFLVGCTLGGIGYGLVSGLNWALASQSITDQDASGRSMGLVVVALTLPSIVVPAMVPVLVDAGHDMGYRALYFVCAASTALAIPVMSRLRALR
jgi:MFS family permease